MVKFFPARQEIANMTPPPTEGEQFLLDFLAEYLDGLGGEFEVFFQAHWDGKFPDVVVMRKNHGILIIEVKDWNLNSYQLEEDARTWTLKNNGSHLKSPIAQAKYYKDLFYNTYSRTLAEENLRNGAMYSLVQSAVFFYGSTDAQVKNFFGFSAETGDRSLKYKHILLLTREQLERGALKKFFELKFLFGDAESKFFNDDIYSELCRVLKPSTHSLSKIFFPEILSRRQRDLSQSRPDYRQQLKGPAGSGKTTVLAFRAVDAYIKTREPVLILTFNITLCNYIHDCISLAFDAVAPNMDESKGDAMKNFVLYHYHGFIADYCNKHNITLEPQLDKDGAPVCDEDGKQLSIYELGEDETPQKYQTIFVDETQDYQRGWMETILRLLKPKGELIFFGDRDQDLYKQGQFDRGVNVPGVVGRPLELTGTYRLRSKILELARAFQVKFFKGSQGNELESPPVSESLFGEFAGDATAISYKYFDAFDVNAVVEIFERVIKENSIANDDVCILSQVLRNVRPVDKALRDKHYKTTTTFEKEEDWQEYHDTDENWRIKSIRQAAKCGFWMESGKIKLATIQSYKGWGIHTEILIIGNDFRNVSDDEKFLNAEMVYTGITRAKKNLVVINIGDKQYDEFFRTETERLSAEPMLTEAEKTALAKQKFNAAGKLFKSGDYSGAIKFLTEAVKLNLNYANAYYNRGLAYTALKQYEQAIQDYDKAIRLNPDLNEVYSNRGNAYQHLQQYERAIQDYTKCIELKPNDVKAYCNRGNIRFNLKQYAQAIQDFDKAVSIKPNEVLFYNNRGIVYKNWGLYACAVQDFGKVLELKPDDVDAYKMLEKCVNALGENRNAN